MSKITIKSSNTFTETTNKGNTLVFQQAAMETNRDYPLVFKLKVGDDKGSRPYPAGEYELDPNSFKTNMFGQLELDSYNIAIRPIQTAEKKAA